MSVRAGQVVKLTKGVSRRQAFWASAGKPGSTFVDLNSGAELVAATDELGGNVMVRTNAATGEEVFVGLAEGEWRGA